MSSIPSSAMPHAGGPGTTEPQSGQQQQQQQQQQTQQSQQQGVGSTISETAGKVADYARENPKTVAAAGVAIVGAIAAAAIPLVRGRGSDETGSKKSGAAKRTTKTND